MPSPSQLRELRIRTLIDWAKKQNRTIQTIDPILQKAQEEYPLISKQTLKDYAATALMMLEKQKEE